MRSPDGSADFSEAGFKRAREYYERLILQFPHTPYSKHSVNAADFYPVMFGVWVYSVQEKSSRERLRLRQGEDGLDDSTTSVASGSERGREVHSIRVTELEEALPIAKRMDELLLGPPYDSDSTLLELRGMVGLWIADLHDAVAKGSMEDEVDTSMTSEDATSPAFRNAAEQHRSNAQSQRSKARDILNSLQTTGHRLPEVVTRFIDDASTVNSNVSPPSRRPEFNSYPDENYS